ncbi:MAG: TolC family protein, partial [Rubripirellula sp.]|nr:TolC family protein [Rubripirellula sp.]
TLNWETCYALVMDNNPVLKAARVRVERARILLQRAKREPIPDIDLMVAHRHHNVTSDNVTTVQAGFPLPLFNRNQGNIRSAEAQWLAATKERERIELGLQDRLAVAYRRYVNAIQQTQRYRDRMIPMAEKSLKLVTDGYEKGQVQYLTLLTAQRTYWQVSLSYLDARKELRTAVSLIEGKVLSESLRNRKLPQN